MSLLHGIEKAWEEETDPWDEATLLSIYFMNLKGSIPH